MKSDGIAFGVAGILFGLIAGWIIGSQYEAARREPLSATQAAASAPAAAQQPAAPPLDEAKVTAFRSAAEKEPKNAAPRAQLGDLYFNSERFDDSIKWYEQALALTPNDVRVNSQLAMAYYYTNQTDRALQQLERATKVDPKHAETWLNLGFVRAFGKQDLGGAEQAWQQVIKLAPETPEGQAAKRAIESLKSAHPGGAPANP
jgi:cytochrome c-type biogenesis protein CcmH/NrfG